MEETKETSREEHLQWCKKRALEYVETGDLQQAYASMCSDLNKHEGTADHSAMALGMGLMVSGSLDTQETMRKFIQDFN